MAAGKMTMACAAGTSVTALSVPPLPLHIPHPGPHHPYPKRTFPWVLDLVCVEKLHEHLEWPGLGLTNGHT